ncbi:hypothetical protein [Cytophaga aurantiaca]|uniref:hypothetical protein n=1 Tax=Cytophaga aurantiaca TaxID=29530 RepID=UPI000368991A|nr:hypothetical protein [Cytophaga aurantiaca]
MKNVIVLLIAFCFASFTSNTSTDTFEVLYDSKPVVLKEGIKLEAGKTLQVINKTSGKVYKVEIAVSLGKRPCYLKTYTNEEAMKPILVTPFVGGACADAKILMLTVNLSTYINIALIK